MCSRTPIAVNMPQFTNGAAPDLTTSLQKYYTPEGPTASGPAARASGVRNGGWQHPPAYRIQEKENLVKKAKALTSMRIANLLEFLGGI